MEKKNTFILFFTSFLNFINIFYRLVVHNFYNLGTLFIHLLYTFVHFNTEEEKKKEKRLLEIKETKNNEIKILRKTKYRYSKKCIIKFRVFQPFT